jgi:hypothetical protein
MTFWHRAPREVYRVYGEDEYLAEEHDGVELPPGGERDGQMDRPVTVSSGPSGSHAARLLGLGLLAGVTLGAVGLVVSNLSHRALAPPRHVVHSGNKARLPGNGSPARRVPTAVSAGAESTVGSPTGATLAYPPQSRSVSRVTGGRPSAATSPRIAPKYIGSYPGSMSFRSATASRQWLSPGDVLGGTRSATSPDGEFGFER